MNSLIFLIILWNKSTCSIKHGFYQLIYYDKRDLIGYYHNDSLKEAWKNRNGNAMNLRAYQLFPILYDAVAFEGGTSTTPATYRIMLAQWEKAFLFKVFQFFPLFFSFIS